MRYSAKYKERVLDKLSSGLSLREVSESTGIAKSTLWTWSRAAKMAGMSSRGDKKRRARKRRRSRFSGKDKLRLLSESQGLTEEELGEFLRREGLHAGDLERFREEALKALDNSGPTKEERRIQRLERELQRKEKALAEAAALLVLQKKLHALEEELEGDDSDESYE